MITKGQTEISTPLTILALDTATTGCSVTVWRDGVVLAHDAREMARGQSEILLPIVVEALKTAGCAAADLRAIAVTRGPGAFTGMRIGLAAARGLALSLSIPCIGVTTLEAVAHGLGEEERRSDVRILAAVESKRADLYVQLFDDKLAALCEPVAADGPALAVLVGTAQVGEGAVVLVGDGAPRALEMLSAEGIEARMSPASALPDTRIVAEIAAGRFTQDANLAPPEPLYLRPPDAKLPKNAGRARA